jgi:hypothetical protein
MPDDPFICNDPFMFVKIPVRPSVIKVVDAFVPTLNPPVASMFGTLNIEKLLILRFVIAFDGSTVAQLGGIPAPPLVNT